MEHQKDDFLEPIDPRYNRVSYPWHMEQLKMLRELTKTKPMAEIAVQMQGLLNSPELQNRYIVQQIKKHSPPPITPDDYDQIFENSPEAYLQNRNI